MIISSHNMRVMSKQLAGMNGQDSFHKYMQKVWPRITGFPLGQPLTGRWRCYRGIIDESVEKASARGMRANCISLPPDFGSEGLHEILGHGDA